ncbi:MAG: hypothetical protein GX879_03325, partial [Bacteroidales bacterium]|nr:hypothetical protein [Bacteroidales bacterium]
INGVIYNVVYDKYRSLYYIIALLPNLDFHYINNPTIERDWSLIVLDKDFKNLGEFLFSKSDYSFLNILPLKEGILFQNAYKQNDNEKTFFTLFEVL